MIIRGEQGVSAYTEGRTVLLTKDRARLGISFPDDPVIPANPLEGLYFYARVSPDGTSVYVDPGLLVFNSLAYVGLGIDVDGGSPGTPFSVTGFTPSTTNGVIYYEAEVVETQILGGNTATSGPVTIGAGSYAFSLTSAAYGTIPGPGFVEGDMLYSTFRPGSTPGYFRKVICLIDVDASGNPYNLRQEHVGAIFVSHAENFAFTDFTANVL